MTLSDRNLYIVLLDCSTLAANTTRTPLADNPSPTQAIDQEQIHALILVRKRIIDLEQLKEIVAFRETHGGGKILELVTSLGFASANQVREAFKETQSVLATNPQRPATATQTLRANRLKEELEKDESLSNTSSKSKFEEVEDVEEIEEVEVESEDLEDLDDLEILDDYDDPNPDDPDHPDLDELSDLDLDLEDSKEENSPPTEENDLGLEMRPAQLDLDMMKELPDRFFEHHNVVIMKTRPNDKRIHLATARPNDLEACNEIEFLTNREVKIVHVSSVSLARSLGLYNKLKNNARIQMDDSEIRDIEENVDRDYSEESPLHRLVNSLIIDALAYEASDIHIEAREADIAVRLRVDGVCRPLERLSKRLLSPMISRLKVMADLNITERRLPQDGRIQFVRFSPAHDIDLRVSIVPMIHGESAVLRLIDRQRATLPLGQLGFDSELLQRYLKAIKAPYGMVLHTGPTGSGKSMSLYSALNSIMSVEDKVLTAEDPVEYTLHGINQLQVHPSIGLTFASALRAFLRQDPDIILVGEIRDPETASMAVEASMTGHKLFSTLHTNDAASSLARLAELGIKPFLLSSCILAICAQRLVRRLCDCSLLEPLTKQQLDLMKRFAPEMKEAYVPVGCNICADSGFVSRFGCFELLINDFTMQQAILHTLSASKLRDIARKSGMQTLFEDALFKVRAGLTSIDEVLRVVVPE